MGFLVGRWVRSTPNSRGADVVGIEVVGTAVGVLDGAESGCILGCACGCKVGC